MRVAVVFGGPSEEHAVSLVSAASVIRGLQESDYEVLPMAIDTRGRWCEPAKSTAILGEIGHTPAETPEFVGSLPLDPRLLKNPPAVVFPVIHGPYGEDGTLQGLLESLSLAYVGCGIAASALCMDKIRSKQIIDQSGIPTAPWLALHRQRPPRPDFQQQIAALGFPLFVKPSRMGSSVGISRVDDPLEMPTALEEAFTHDFEVLIEKGLNIREIEVAVLGNTPARASLPGEIRPSDGFYDFEGKYLNNSSRLLAPAPLDEETTAAVRETALRIYDILGCEGMARVDLFIEKNSGRILYNEVNTIPGFTGISMYPKLWGISGLPFPELLNELLRLGLERFARSAPATSRLT